MLCRSPRLRQNYFFARFKSEDEAYRSSERARVTDCEHVQSFTSIYALLLNTLQQPLASPSGHLFVSTNIFVSNCLAFCHELLCDGLWIFPSCNTIVQGFGQPACCCTKVDSCRTRSIEVCQDLVNMCFQCCCPVQIVWKWRRPQSASKVLGY